MSLRKQPCNYIWLQASGNTHVHMHAYLHGAGGVGGQLEAVTAVIL